MTQPSTQRDTTATQPSIHRGITGTKRRWIKIYTNESLYGSIRYQLSAAERGVWFDLLLLSAQYSNTGDIADRDNKKFPLAFIARTLNIRLNLLKRTLTKCIDEGRITSDATGIHITNWSRYQSEYDRQKQYRQKEAPADKSPF